MSSTMSDPRESYDTFEAESDARNMTDSMTADQVVPVDDVEFTADQTTSVDYADHSSDVLEDWATKPCPVILRYKHWVCNPCCEL